MKNILSLVLCIIAFALNDVALAAEPDFFINFSECSATIGSTVNPESTLKTTAGDPVKMTCVRKSKNVTCDLSFEKGQKTVTGRNTHEYVVTLETGDQLDLQLLPAGGDYIAINRTAHTAILITRVFGETFGGAKTCRGIFLTIDEVKALSSQK